MAKWPFQFVQTYGGEIDVTQPVRSHDEYFGITPCRKRPLKRVCWMPMLRIFRTGTIRPANGIYGNQDDHTVGTYTKLGTVPTYVLPHALSINKP